MIENIDCYHGTLKANAQSIIREQNIRLSRGKKHWLGDGAYFFKQSFWAYWWIRESYLSEYEPEYDNIYEIDLSETYSIIEASLKYEFSRKFNLDNIEHRYEYERTKKLMIEKGKLSSNVEENKIVDGVVINYMFSILFYDEQFDFVIATFEKNHDRSDVFKTRFKNLKQVQICVRNVNIIENLEEFDYFQKLSKYYKILNRWFPKHRFVSNDSYVISDINIYE
jgi:hypothetical protein